MVKVPKGYLLVTLGYLGMKVTSMKKMSRQAAHGCTWSCCNSCAIYQDPETLQFSRASGNLCLLTDRKDTDIYLHELYHMSHVRSGGSWPSEEAEVYALLLS